MRISAVTSAAVAMLTLSAGANVAVAETRNVTCESTGGQQRFCPTETRWGVTLTNQLSRTACRQGSTWWYDDRGIYVTNGCRAQFAIGDGHRAQSHNNGSDNDGAAAIAALAILAAGAAAVHHEHEKDRRERARQRNDYQSYDYRPPQNNPYPYSYQGSPQVRTLRCESAGGDYRYCNADVRRHHVEMEHQLSKTSCRFGQNWGYDPHGIWVNDGCRGDFAIYP